VSAVTFAKKESVAPAPSRQLRIGEPDDAYEREADRVADEILAGGRPTRHWSLPRIGANPETPVLRRCSCGASSSSEGECAACKQQREADGLTLRRKAAAGFESAVAPPSVHQVLNSPGQPLDTATREYFEPRLGHDLALVRVHSDSVAAESAGAVRAKAYTVGNHIAFAGGQFAPWTSEGRTLLGHELVHVAQQAGGAPIYVARAGDPYVSPYNETLATELFEHLRQLRIVEGGASAVQQAKRVGAVAALFDRQGNRLATIARMNVPGGAHAEELVVQEIQRRIAAGLKIEYTVLMVDQDPCPGTCNPLLKQWRGNPESGTLRVVTPMAVNKRDPSQMVSGKTAYKRALTQDAVPFEPKAPPPDNAAFLATRGEISRVRPPLYKEPPPTPPGNISPAPAAGAGSDVAADVSARTEAAAAKAVGKAEEQAAAHALEDAAAARLSKQITKTAEKDLAEAGAEAFTKSATSAASRRLGQAVTPVVGAAFAFPDAWKGVQDIAHGNVVLGLGTIGVAIIDVASQGLHLTDEITAGGGTILAITIQTWAATMQFGFEAVRISARAAELQAYMKAHGNALPPRAELMSYYGLNDEDILLLENDLYKAQQKNVSTEDLANEVRALLAQIDANANKPLPEGVTPEGIQRERASLSKLLVALDAENGRKRAQAAKDRAAADEKRRQANFDRAQQQHKQAAAAPATQQLLPGPGAPPQQPAAGHDPFGILSPVSAQPLSRISMENAELAGTGFGRIRTTLLGRYRQLESEHFPSDKVKAFQGDVTAYVSTLDRAIAEYMKKGSAEWPGVKEMRRLRDAADNDDRSRLMR
jgi:hypothetical protein